MRTVQVRPATAADAVGIAEVQTRSWQQAYAGMLPADFLASRVVDPAGWADRLAHPPARTAAHVAAAGDRVVGFAGVGPVLAGVPDPTLGQLYTLYVLAAHWGTGVGHRLHAAGLNSLTEAGFAGAVLWVLRENRRAIEFYRRQGWRLDGHQQVERMGAVALVELRMTRELADGVRRGPRGAYWSGTAR